MAEMRRKLKQACRTAGILITPIWEVNIFNSKVNAKAYVKNWKENLNKTFSKILKICTTLTATYFRFTKTIFKKWEKQSRKRKFIISPKFRKTLPKPIAKHTQFRITRRKRHSYIRKVNIKITLNEIQEAVKYLKNKKAPGLDRITNEMF